MVIIRIMLKFSVGMNSIKAVGGSSMCGFSKQTFQRTASRFMHGKRFSKPEKPLNEQTIGRNNNNTFIQYAQTQTHIEAQGFQVRVDLCCKMSGWGWTLKLIKPYFVCYLYILPRCLSLLQCVGRVVVVAAAAFVTIVDVLLPSVRCWSRVVLLNRLQICTTDFDKVQSWEPLLKLSKGFDIYSLENSFHHSVAHFIEYLWFIYQIIKFTLNSAYISFLINWFWFWFFPIPGRQRRFALILHYLSEIDATYVHFRQPIVWGASKSGWVDWWFFRN